MPNFSTDSDLIALEPMVFHELPFAGQTKLRVTDASIDGPAVTSAAGGFSRLSPGDVALIGEGAFAIAAVIDDHSLTLAGPPVDIAGSTLTVRTFAPQAALVRDELLRAVGVDPDDPDPEHGAAAILSAALMTRLEALGTLAVAYAAGVSVAGDSRRVLEKADRHHRHYRRRLLGAAVVLDLDGDGRPDAIRHPGLARLVRA